MKKRDDGVAVASAEQYANHLHLTPAPHHSIFLPLDAIPDAQPTVSKHKSHDFPPNIDEYCYGTDTRGKITDS